MASSEAVAQEHTSTVRHSDDPSEQYPIPGVTGRFVGGDVGGDVGCVQMSTKEVELELNGQRKDDHSYHNGK
eukprot:scaffold10542_cov81-Skeletonema_dohrnii-CCMP3373.AAC.2